MDLTNSELFKDLTAISEENQFFDLHNDYSCKAISYDSATKVLRAIFEPCKSKTNNLCLEFTEARIAKLFFYFSCSQDASTISAFYRGRFEIEGELLEYLKSDERYFYIDFQEEDKLEVFAKKVSLFELS